MIIIRPIGGLCNRMRAIKDAYLLANDLNMEMILVWDIDYRMGCTFNEIFEEIENVKVIDIFSGKVENRNYIDQLMKKSMTINDTWSGNINKYINKNKELNFDFFKTITQKDIFISTCFEFYDRKPSVENYDIFKVKEYIIAKVNEIINNERLIGVHIRRTDNKPAIENSPMYLFEKIINEEIRAYNSKFFLATDDINVENYFIKKYPGKITTNRNKDFSRTSKQGSIDAAIDLYCLSKCSKIFGSHYSSFTDIASQINNTTLIRVINRSL